MKNIAHLHVFILLNLINYFLWVYCSSYFAQIIFQAPIFQNCCCFVVGWYILWISGANSLCSHRHCFSGPLSSLGGFCCSILRPRNHQNLNHYPDLPTWWFVINLIRGVYKLPTFSLLRIRENCNSFPWWKTTLVEVAKDTIEAPQRQRSSR